MAIETSKKELCSQDVQIFVNDRKIALAQECKVKTTRDAKLISAYGEGNASVVAVGAKQHLLTLSRIEMVSQDMDFANLSDFTVALKKQGKKYLFSCCQWTELCEHIVNGKAVLQTASIVSPTLCVTEAV
ncbi:MAG: hypothetical protein RR911_05775 [Oscillospiraceae bacterium]